MDPWFVGLTTVLQPRLLLFTIVSEILEYQQQKNYEKF